MRCNNSVAFGAECSRPRKEKIEYCTDNQQGICFHCEEGFFTTLEECLPCKGPDVSRCDGDDVLLCRDGALLTATGCVPKGDVVARKNHVVYCGRGQTIDNGACQSCSVPRCKECFNATHCAVCNGFPQEDGQCREPHPSAAVTTNGGDISCKEGWFASGATCQSCHTFGAQCLSWDARGWLS